MKLQLPAIRLPFLPRYWRVLSASPPYSVSDHKKTSLTGWLSLPQTQHLSSHISFSPHGPAFPSAFPTSVAYSNSK
jgi:hypothetical protein